MFGGLEIKSVASPDRAKAKEPATAETGSAAQTHNTTSAFGFLNSESTTEASSVPGPTTSAFSFLSSDSAKDAPQTAVADGDSLTEAPLADPSAAAPSAFSFLMPNEAATATEAAQASSSPAEPASLNSFGFLPAGEPGDLPPPPPPPAEDLLSSPTTTPSFSSTTPVLGSGIVFGGAMQQAAAVKKKRTRTNKIGQGTAANSNAITAMPDPVSLPAPSSLGVPQPAATQTSKSISKSDILTAAEQATLRAEQFIQSQAAATSTFVSGYSVEDQEDDDDERNRTIQSVPSEDSVVQKAKAAALEAQEIMHDTSSSSTGGNKYFAGRIGGLFRPRTSETGATMNNSHHGNGGHHLKSSSSASSMESTRQQPAISVPRPGLPPTQRKATQAESVKALSHPQTSGGISFVPPVSSFDRATSAPINLQPLSSPQTSDPYAAIQPKITVATTTATTTKKPKTPTERFHDMLEQFRDKVVTYMDQITRLRQDRAGLLEERFVTLAKERLATQQIEAAQTQQQLSAEQEDFDLAEQLQTIIQGHEREQTELVTVKDNISRALERVDDQRKQIIHAVTEEFSRIQQKLKDFEKEQDNLECSQAAEHVAKFTVVAKQLSAEQERLSHDLKHLERDVKLVAEERKELEAAISEQTIEMETLRDDAKTKLKTVEEEIEELRRQLAAKQQIAAKLRTEAAGHEEAILKVRVKFARQLTRVQRKEMSVKDAREEWELEKQSFDRNKDEHDRSMAEHSEQLLAQEKLRASLAKEMQLAETFGEIIAKEIGLGFISSEDDEDSGDLAQMHTEVVKCEAAVTEAKTILKATSASVANMDEEIRTLELKIPLLEETKKECAAKRDFKGAGVASKEIKEATSRVNECRDAIDEARERKASAERNVQELEEELAAKRLVAQEHEKETNLAVMDRLADKMKRLMDTKQKVCDDADRLSVKGVGAYVLHSQIKALQSEGQSLGEKYGGWDQRIAGIGFADDVEGEVGSTAKDKIEASGEDENPPERKEQATASKTQDVAPEIMTSQESLEEKQARYRALASRLGDVESGIEAAAEAEDFEKAAEMQDELDNILVELQSLDLTDEEMEAALAGAPTESVSPPIATDQPTEETENVDKSPTTSGNEAAESPSDDEHAGLSEDGGSKDLVESGNDEATGASSEPDVNEQSIDDGEQNGEHLEQEMTDTPTETGGDVDKGEDELPVDVSVVEIDGAIAVADDEIVAVMDEEPYDSNEDI